MAVVACDVLSGEPVVFRNGPATLALLASTALPGVFPPISHDGQLLVDGGFTGLVPTEVVRAMGADLVIAVDADPPCRVREVRNGLEVLLRALDICAQRHKQWLLRQADVVIQPEFGEPIGPLDFSRSRQCVEAGARAGRLAVPDIRARLERIPAAELGSAARQLASALFTSAAKAAIPAAEPGSAARQLGGKLREGAMNLWRRAQGRARAAGAA